MEDKSKIAINLSFLQSLSCLDSLPSGSHFDQNSVRFDSLIFVELHYSFGPIHCLSFIEGEFGVDLGGNNSRHYFEDIASKRDGNVIESEIYESFPLFWGKLLPLNRIILFLFLALAQIAVKVFGSKLD